MNIIDVCLTTVARCTLLGAVLGGVLHVNESDTCMIPAPIPAIFYAIAWGVGGFIVGLLLSPAAVAHEQRKNPIDLAKNTRAWSYFGRPQSLPTCWFAHRPPLSRMAQGIYYVSPRTEIHQCAPH
jgi:hypothetical protein